MEGMIVYCERRDASMNCVSDKRNVVSNREG